MQCVAKLPYFSVLRQEEENRTFTEVAKVISCVTSLSLAMLATADSMQKHHT